ncbi:uncharacterized protein LOC118458874 [Anopheles albimanus]|uniref:uncharacterized protein LOC118458874 n=1 Tax=Anopheles albimanus TaxID=7167 RepID=UPI00163FDBEA|nr:uncharacterized protein LOC118458874 [Anopheles albimanus]
MGHSMDLILPDTHILFGSSNGDKLPVRLDESVTAAAASWKTALRYASQLWKHWVKEYLPRLTTRTKWFDPAVTLTVGNIVIVIDTYDIVNNLPRDEWPKDRVVEAEQSILGVSNQLCITLLWDNPDSTGTSLKMLRYAAGTPLHLAKCLDIGTLQIQLQRQLLGLLVSPVLDQQVAFKIRRMLVQCSRGMGPLTTMEIESDVSASAARRSQKDVRPHRFIEYHSLR